jgi:hypothetical protein
MADVKKRTVIKKTRQFEFVRQERPGKKTWYEIKFSQWTTKASTWEELKDVIDDLNAIFATNKAKKQTSEFTWFFWKYEEADAAFTMAALKYTQ